MSFRKMMLFKIQIFYTINFLVKLGLNFNNLFSKHINKVLLQNYFSSLIQIYSEYILI